MKKKHLLSFIILIFGISSCSTFTTKENKTSAIRTPSSEHGRKVGNGGGACVCRDPKKKSHITYAELIDFVYIRELTEGRLMVPRGGIIKYTDILSSIYSDNSILEEGRSLLKKEIESLPKEFYARSSLSLRDTVDSEIEVDCAMALNNNHCEYEQAANFTNSGNLKIKKDIFDAFTETDKAGLLLHEAVYSLDRKINKAEWADKTREIVGSYFAREAKPLNDFLSFSKTPENSYATLGSLVLLKVEFGVFPAFIRAKQNNTCVYQFANLNSDADDILRFRAEFMQAYNPSENTVTIPCDSKVIQYQNPGQKSN